MPDHHIYDSIPSQYLGTLPPHHAQANPATSLTMFAYALLAITLALSASAVDVTLNPDLIAKLITANSQLDRLALLPDDAKDWHFDFTAQKNYIFAPGGVVNMNAATFPAAKGNRMTCESLFPSSCQDGWTIVGDARSRAVRTYLYTLPRIFRPRIH